MRSLPPAFRAELARLRETFRHPPEQLLNPHPDPGADIDTLLGALEASTEWSTAGTGEPAGVGSGHRGVATLVAEFWELAFAEEWERMHPALERAGQAMSAKIADNGLLGLLDRVAPWIAALPGRHEIQFACTAGEDAAQPGTSFDVRGMPVTVVPSLFAAPHVYVDVETPAAVQFVVPVQAVVRETSPPPELAGSLLACASDARLRLLHVLAEQPRTVQELAPMLSMAPSTVSKHLQRLAEHGLVCSERDGWYVLYQLCRSRVHELVRDLAQYIDAAD